MEYSRQVRIRVSDAGLIPDLRQHFERSGFVTNRVADDVIEILRRAVHDEAQETRAIESHLAVWRAMQPEADVELLP